MTDDGLRSLVLAICKNAITDLRSKNLQIREEADNFINNCWLEDYLDIKWEVLKGYYGERKKKSTKIVY